VPYSGAGGRNGGGGKVSIEIGTWKKRKGSKTMEEGKKGTDD